MSIFQSIYKLFGHNLVKCDECGKLFKAHIRGRKGKRGNFCNRQCYARQYYRDYHKRRVTNHAA